MRLLRSTLLFTVLALALAAAGCGSSGSDVPEVPGPPAELSVPHVKGAADLSEDASATPTPTPSADATETPTPAAPQQDSASNDPSTSGGTPPQQFEQFCQENAGAC